MSFPLLATTILSGLNVSSQAARKKLGSSEKKVRSRNLVRQRGLCRKNAASIARNLARKCRPGCLGPETVHSGVRVRRRTLRVARRDRAPRQGAAERPPPTSLRWCSEVLNSSSLNTRLQPQSPSTARSRRKYSFPREPTRSRSRQGGRERRSTRAKVEADGLAGQRQFAAESSSKSLSLAARLAGTQIEPANRS